MNLSIMLGSFFDTMYFGQPTFLASLRSIVWKKSIHSLFSSLTAFLICSQSVTCTVLLKSVLRLESDRMLWAIFLTCLRTSKPLSMFFFLPAAAGIRPILTGSKFALNSILAAKTRRWVLPSKSSRCLQYSGLIIDLTAISWDNKVSQRFLHVSVSILSLFFSIAGRASMASTVCVVLTNLVYSCSSFSIFCFEEPVSVLPTVLISFVISFSLALKKSFLGFSGVSVEEPSSLRPSSFSTICVISAIFSSQEYSVRGSCTSFL